MTSEPAFRHGRMPGTMILGVQESRKDQPAQREHRLAQAQGRGHEHLVRTCGHDVSEHAADPWSILARKTLPV
jgi:hypothetical protein